MKWLWNLIVKTIMQKLFRSLPPEIQDQERDAINDTYPHAGDAGVPTNEIRKAEPVRNKQGTPIVR